jgi:sec-independent protein translocase protein TatB
MFDVGFSEVLLIALVALLVFGPDRLPKMVRETTYWIRKIKGAMHAAKSEIDRELQLMEIRTAMEEKRQRFVAEAQTLQEEVERHIDPSVESKALIDKDDAGHGS